MPPSAVKTIRDLLFWQYAKLISKSSGFGIDNRAFQMSTFIKLRDGKMKWSPAIREWVKEHEKPNECVYCGSKGNLTTEHIMPQSWGGPNIADNAIMVCKKCNSTKSDKGLYEWMRDDYDNIPRIAEGKYLKLLYDLHEKNGTLNVSRDELVSKLCPNCAHGKLCEEEEIEGELSILCLEGVFKK